MILVGQTGGGLSSVPDAGGNLVPVTVYDRTSETNQYWPQFLPDGNHYLYWIRRTREEETGIYLGSIAVARDKQPKRLILPSQFPATYADGYLVFPRDTTLFAQPFDASKATLSGSAMPVMDIESWRAAPSVSGAGVLALSPRTGDSKNVAIVDREGKLLRTVGERGAYHTVRLSPDGRTAALGIRSATSSNIELWLMDLESGIPTRLISHRSVSLYPVWSPDGSEVVFSSTRGGPYSVYSKSVFTDAVEKQLNGAEIRGFPDDWSKDGKRIAVARRGPEEQMYSEILTMDSGMASVMRIAGQTCRFSPDGRWVAFESRETGTAEIYVQGVPGQSGGAGPKVRVSRSGGTLAAWRADGGELFFSSPDNRLMSVDVKTAEGRFVASEPKLLFT